MVSPQFVGNKKQYNALDALSKTVVTDLDLPMTADDLVKLVELLEKIKPFPKYIGTKDNE